MGNNLVSFPFETVEPLENGLFGCGSNGKLGICDSSGQKLTPVQFNLIKNAIPKKDIYLASDSLNNYMINSEYKISQIEKADDVLLSFLNDSYFSLRILDKESKKRDFIVYNFNFDEIAKFEDIYTLRYSTKNFNLPTDFIMVKKGFKSKYVIFDLKKGKYLEVK